MDKFEIERYNPIYLYERLFSEITSQIKPILASVECITPNGPDAFADSWLPYLLGVLKKRPLKLLRLLTTEHLSITDFKLYIIESEQELKTVFDFPHILPTCYADFLDDTVKETLLECRNNFKSINEKLSTCFITAMTACLNRDLRTFSINLLDCHEESEQGVFFNLELPLASLSNANPNVMKLKEELVYLVNTIAPSALYQGCADAVNNFRGTTEIAAKLDASCITHQCLRLEYLSQNLDIPNIILGGYCNVDVEIWSQTNEKPRERSLVSHNPYRDLHQLNCSVERIQLQIEYEKRICHGGSPILRVESKQYCMPKNLSKAIQANKEFPEHLLIQAKQEARMLAKRAFEFALTLPRTEVIFFYLHLCAEDSSHRLGFKFLKRDGKLYGQFRDSNAGTFEFNSSRVFANWFSDFYIIMDYHIAYNKYSFSYPAPLNYVRAYEWLSAQSQYPRLQLAMYAQQQINEFNEHSGPGALQFYRNIRNPNNVDKQQMLYCLLASSSYCANTNPVLSKYCLNTAEMILLSMPSPQTRLDALMHANVYASLAYINVIDHNMNASLEPYQALFFFLNKHAALFPKQILNQIQTIIGQFSNNASLQDLKMSTEELDLQLSTLNIPLNTYFAQKLHAITEPCIQHTAYQMEQLFEYSYNAQKQGLHLYESMQRKQYKALEFFLPPPEICQHVARCKVALEALGALPKTKSIASGIPLRFLNLAGVSRVPAVMLSAQPSAPSLPISSSPSGGFSSALK